MEKFDGNYKFFFDFDTKLDDLKKGDTHDLINQNEQNQIITAMTKLKKITNNNPIYIVTLFPSDKVETYFTHKYPKINELIIWYYGSSLGTYEKNIGETKTQLLDWTSTKFDRLRTETQNNPNNKLIYFSDNPKNTTEANSFVFKTYTIGDLTKINDQIDDAINIIVDDIVWYDEPTQIIKFPSGENSQKCIRGNKENISYNYFTGILNGKELTKYTPIDEENEKDRIYFCPQNKPQKGGNSNYETYKVNKHNFISFSLTSH